MSHIQDFGMFVFVFVCKLPEANICLAPEAPMYSIFCTDVIQVAVGSVGC